MGRWEPNASGRLRDAAMALYVERGYQQTTVAEIAERAGLTPRTFFRYFADKREVLFGGASMLQDHMVEALAAVPASAPPMEALAAALDAAAEFLGERHDFARQRQTVIADNDELKERELIKMASLAATLTDGLRARGVPDPDAGLVAETGIAVFRVAFETWVNEPGDRELRQVMRESLERLALIAGG